MKKFSTFVLMLAGASLCAIAGMAQESTKHDAAIPEVKAVQAANDPLRALFFVQQFKEVTVSPDGRRVAWVETQIDKEGAETGKHDIYVSEYEEGLKALRITAGTGGVQLDEHGLAWSPDSRQLAFLSDSVKK